MNRTSTRASLAALAAASVLLAGCNGGDDKGDDKPTDGGSSATTSDSPSAAGSPSSSSGTTSGGATLDKADFYETIIAAQREAGSYRSTSTTSSTGASMVLEGEATFEGGKLLGHAKSGPKSAQPMETVVAGGVLYLKSEGLGVPAGKWLKLDSNDPANADSPLAGLAAAADPEATLRAAGELEKLEKVGSEKVDGVDADHYEAVMTTKSFADALNLPAEVAKELPARLPFDVWVDGENRPVKMTTTFEIGGTTSTSEQRYFDYGADISVTVPKDSETVTPADLGLDKG